MAGNENFAEIFESLKKILMKYEKKLKVKTSGNTSYQLIGPYSEKYKNELWFGGVLIKKNYVSYYLMPVYMYKDLAESIPANLKKRMQGKSCFNFKKVDKELFKQLAALTSESYKMFKERGDNMSMNC